MAAVEEVLQHPKKVKINKARHLAEQKGVMHQHLLEWQQAGLKFLQPLTPFGAPLVEAAFAELAFFETEILQLIGRADEFLVVNVV